MAHAEAERVAAAARDVANAAATQSKPLHAAIAAALAGSEAPSHLTDLPPDEREALVSRSRTRALVGGTRPALSAMVSDVAAGLAAEAQRLAGFADAVDLLLGSGQQAIEPTLKTRLATVQAEYAQVAQPTTDVARAVHAALTQGLAQNIGLSAMVYSLAVGREGGATGSPLGDAATPSESDIRRALHKVSLLLSLRMLDAIDLHLDTARGAE